MVRLTLVINILALALVLAILLQLELPDGAALSRSLNAITNTLANWASLLWDTLVDWVDRLAPWFERVWEKAAAWYKAAAAWVRELIHPGST